MLSNINRLWMFPVAAAVMLLTTDVAQAQCSRGGRSSTYPADSADTFNMFSSIANSRNHVASQRQFTYQERLMTQQRMAFAARQQQLAQARLAQQKDLQAMRLARADANRAKRAGRIAALRAKHATENGKSEEGMTLTSTASGTNPSRSQSDRFDQVDSVFANEQFQF